MQSKAIRIFGTRILWILVSFIVIGAFPNAAVAERGTFVETFGPQLSSVENLDWFSEEAGQYIDKVKGIWARGTSAIIVDVETGITFSASRNGGWNHADWEPETKADTAKLKKMYGGCWSWNRRPVLVLIGDKTFAASINGMPHGGDRIRDNGYGGHSCCHFLNSRLHKGNKRDARHQKAVRLASAASIDIVQALIQNHQR